MTQQWERMRDGAHVISRFVAARKLRVRSAALGDQKQQSGKDAMQKPHGRNPRAGRFSEPGRVYLVTTVMRDRLPHFCDFHLGRLARQSPCAKNRRARKPWLRGHARSPALVVAIGRFHALSRVVADVKSVSSSDQCCP
jgi:hypothetical protein